MTTEQSRGDAEPLLKVSVIVAVYNGRNTLERCLRAVAASDYPNYECIVVDDSSTDDTGEIAAQYDSRVLGLTGGPRGPAYARNRGA
jgi:glycosyltransferase involved in cell wall biosynthesis